MSKKKLTISEQIEDMHKKGITFHFTNEKDACKFLKHNNYYFKLKSYGKNYDKYLTTAKKGQYINLDFSYLQELSILDMYLRKSIISKLIKSVGIKQSGINNLHWLFNERMLKHKKYFLHFFR